ncbi:30S ribosomal protein S2 [Candidatus Dojkabacteria bacterium]|nr:30S ribosomal protein S2 [Candidatus Dojkabacteria bacterium]
MSNKKDTNKSSGTSPKKSKKGYPVEIPELQTFLKAGAQFGHETKRWDPKMEKFIFASKKDIHIIDLSQTVVLLKKALRFLTEAARQGPVMFVGTKRQAAEIVKEEAVRAGAYYVIHRWAGGLLTNFKVIKKSLKKLDKLEERFDKGIEGRTKYEISKLKIEWGRLDRLYGGIKGMKRLPTALVVIDPRYEIGAVVEANRLDIPIIAVTDTNCNPEVIDYVVPGNDDALGSVGLFMKLFADAVLVGNGGEGVKHTFKDYSETEVKIVKQNEDKKEDEESVEQEKKTVGKFRIKKGNKTNKIDKKEKMLDKKKEKSSKKETSKKEKTEKQRKKQEKEAKKKAEKTKTSKKTKGEKKLSSRVQNALDDADISVEKARKMTKEELMEIKGIGEKSAEEVLE